MDSRRILRGEPGRRPDGQAVSHPDGVVLESVPCIFGCSAGDDKILSGRDRLHGLPGEYDVVRCRACGLMRTNPRPTQETMAFYYPEDYGPHRNLPRETAPILPCTPVPFWKRLLRSVYHFVCYGMYRFHSENVPTLPPGRMMEIGCGTGSYLGRMANKGWKVEGLEFSERAAQVARAAGFAVRTGPLEAVPDPGNRYDLIVGWMVLEHLHNPLLGLRKLRSWLSPGGWLVFSVPNAGSIEFRIFRDAWYALQLPSHLYHFTPRTVGMLLDRAGWRAEKIFHHRLVSNLVASTGYLLSDLGYDNRLAAALRDFPEGQGRAHYRVYPLSYLLSVFGQTGRMTVWARRVDD